MAHRTVLFDLDGTLADTGPDLAYALNHILEEEQRAVMAYERIRPKVSHGGAALLHLGFPELNVDSAQFDTLRNRMLAVYRANIARHTRLFPGMDAVLDTIEARHELGRRHQQTRVAHRTIDGTARSHTARGQHCQRRHHRAQ